MRTLRASRACSVCPRYALTQVTRVLTVGQMRTRCTRDICSSLLMDALIVTAARTLRSPEACSLCVGYVLALAATISHCRFREPFPSV